MNFSLGSPIWNMIGMIAVGFIIVFAVFRIGKGWVQYNAQPVVSMPAKVVGRRTEVSGGGWQNTPSQTTYYATFESENGARIELRLNGSEYGMLVEGDVGILTYKDIFFEGFHRHI